MMTVCLGLSLPEPQVGGIDCAFSGGIWGHVLHLHLAQQFRHFLTVALSGNHGISISADCWRQPRSGISGDVSPFAFSRDESGLQVIIPGGVETAPTGRGMYGSAS